MLNISFINSTTIYFLMAENRDYQYLVESIIKLVVHDQSHLKPLPKAERKII